MNNLKINFTLLSFLFLCVNSSSMEPERDAIASQIKVKNILMNVWKNNTAQSVSLEDISDFSDIFDSKPGNSIIVLQSKETQEISKEIPSKKDGLNKFYNVLRIRTADKSDALIWKFLYTNSTKKLITSLYLKNMSGTKKLKEENIDLSSFLKEQNLSTVQDKALIFNLHGFIDGDNLKLTNITIYPEIIFLPVQTKNTKNKSFISKIFTKK